MLLSVSEQSKGINSNSIPLLNLNFCLTLHLLGPKAYASLNVAKCLQLRLEYARTPPQRSRRNHTSCLLAWLDWIACAFLACAFSELCANGTAQPIS